jgi:hypothetical protein
MAIAGRRVLGIMIAENSSDAAVSVNIPITVIDDINPPTPTPLPLCLDGDNGNLDCDSGGLIDETDLSILLGSWAPFGPVPTPVAEHHSADISPTGGDGKIDSGDLSKLLSNWRIQ